ncbi:kinase-like domain-containing protein [Lasiosphaeria miniovina]|uniref:cyclin-dependent kinase n=1 Tax=Lasiosphaeria miniovina TaxID=1954250 RepID=A0AA40AW08_9PEZI|nr:kinase-like domain-containing protein [Lasiosphaeria miniovina]KAK0723070.1 kinase-like domain-containing protein [Lasiosphaeria miniovina]
MSTTTGKIKSRWADDETDAALEAQAKKEREEKKRQKAEKARKLEEEKRAREAEAAASARQAAPQQGDDDTNPNSEPPSKRRRISPERETGPPGRAAGVDSSSSGTTLLRLGGARGAFGPCRSVENYDKLNDIEEGAYGWVARAKELKTGNVVALKRLKIDPKDRSGLPVTGLREIQILKDCSHRNVVKLREVVVGEDTSKIENIFLVLEFLEHDLKGILEDMPEPFLASEVKTLLLQLASGVAYLHGNYILHRDLKTSNLLLNNRGQLKIADFGMARYVGDPPPKLTQLVVTLWYRAPELLLGAARYGAAVDMWSVGCIFGELLTREPLLQGKNEVDELTKIFELCGIPTDESWPGFRRLPNARALRLPKIPAANGSVVRAKFPLLTAAGVALLNDLLALDPAKRPAAEAMLAHEYFKQDPKPKQEAMFPTFPSKAGQERRRRQKTPNAPVRGQAADPLGAVDFSGIFSGREKEERGGGFSLRMV